MIISNLNAHLPYHKNNDKGVAMRREVKTCVKDRHNYGSKYMKKVDSRYRD